MNISGDISKPHDVNCKLKGAIPGSLNFNSVGPAPNNNHFLITVPIIHCTVLVSNRSYLN